MKHEPTILGFATAAIVGILAALILPSCMSYSKVDPATGIETRINLVASKAGALVVNGPMPTVKGSVPIMNKKGVVIGHKVTYSAPDPNAPKADLAIYDIDQTDVPREIAKAAKDSVLGWVAGQIIKNYDNNQAGIEKENITAASKKATEANNLKLTQENNRHTEALTEMEVPATTPTP